MSRIYLNLYGTWTDPLKEGGANPNLIAWNGLTALDLATLVEKTDTDLLRRLAGSTIDKEPPGLKLNPIAKSFTDVSLAEESCPNGEFVSSVELDGEGGKISSIIKWFKGKFKGGGDKFVEYPENSRRLSVHREETDHIFEEVFTLGNYSILFIW